MTTQNRTTTNNEPFSDNQSMVDQCEIVYLKPDDDFQLSDEEDSYTNDTTVMSTKVLHHARKLSLYEREMQHMKKKEKFLNAKRVKLIQAREEELQDAPEVMSYLDIYTSRKQTMTMFRCIREQDRSMRRN